MKSNRILLACVLVLVTFSACGTPAPTLELPTAGPAATVAVPRPTETASPVPPTLPPPAGPRILYSIADGALPVANTFTVPRGAGLIHVENGTSTALGLPSAENGFFNGTPFDWSPDGRRVVFVSTRAGSANLYVMNADGSNAARITTGGENGYPAWSPNGEWIAFASTRGGESNVYLTRPDGTETSCLTCDLAGSETSPAWSPDSASLAFTIPDEPGPVSIIHIATGEARPVSSPELRSAAPAFSPDGQWFIFECEQNICLNDIYGLTLNMFSSGQAVETQPRISPDGKQIAFISNRDGNYELYIMTIEGGEVLRLTTNPYPEMHPAWSPDGQWIAFASATVFQETYTNFDIFIIRPDGKDMQPLAQSPENEFFPLWSPQE
ncbi:MAG: APHP domain-containing protein [Anaerolineaceae bacterium]|nr:MAG: APHP domain-containing protein [Anaerolineaceae bacterium]